jgi:two-component system sensor histidine kinase UhpB
MRLSRLPLLWRVFAINATLLVIATLLLALTPVTIHEPIAIVEAIVLAVALALMLAANLVLLRHTLRPIERLVDRMRKIDLLQPGQRISEQGGVEVAELTRGFNEMLERLETERRESAQRALRAQEAERRRIAGGLHDEVGQVLTGVLLRLEDDETKEAVRQALEEVRRIARELRPEMLEQLGLVSALTELSRKFADSSGIRVERRFATDLPPLSDDSELAVYRVAQESLTNVARHAAASRVEIALQPGPDSVVLRIIDDGRGIPAPDPFTLNGHGGLRGMRERALLVGGFKQMLERLEVERQESGRRALQAQEAERRRIAGGLHDEVGQVLTGVLLRLDDDETKEAVRQALDEVRRIARELRPEMLEHLGLVSALTELSRKFSEQSGVRVDRRFADELPALSDEEELAVYRVAQESLTNVARHAGASRVELSLEPGAGSVVLRVADDGHGMPDHPSTNGHGGLRGMRERALLVGGALAIKPGRTGGVEVRLEVPAGGTP